MKIQQCVVTSNVLTVEGLAPLQALSPQLVLVFASPTFCTDPRLLEMVHKAFPSSVVAGCSTAGEISAQGVGDESAVITALQFQSGSEVRTALAPVASMADSRQGGRSIGQALAGEGLRAILLFGKGLEINGSALIEGVVEAVGHEIPISGGLAGDNGAFSQTYVFSNQGLHSDAVVGVGLYGTALRIGHGSVGGWSSFGPARKVTRCEGNVLYELDGLPALQLYKDYLGEYAAQLPASGLLFPFEMLAQDESAVGLIRTILAVDEAQGSLVLAGEIDPNGYLRLMHASTLALVEGAEEAARRSLGQLTEMSGDRLALLVSCVGRKLVMGDQVEDEVEAVTGLLGEDAVAAGFYSYGEISPFDMSVECKLHNQTMTVTLLGEI